MPIEAELLRAYATELRLAIDETRLRRQASATVETWEELAPDDRRCVFLGETGACRVYEHRPIACRKHFVMSPPITCLDTHTWRWIAPLAEIIATAAYTVFGCRSMPETLKKEA
jgi:Fe-S-cluster containining protein